MYMGLEASKNDMKRRCGSILALVAAVMCLAGTPLAAGQANPSGVHEFTMTAKKL